MADAQLRQAERRRHVSPEARVRWVQELLRHGGCSGCRPLDVTTWDLDLVSRVYRDPITGATVTQRGAYLASQGGWRTEIQDGQLHLRECTACNGLTTTDRVGLAAYCGEGACRAVVSVGLPAVDDLRVWALGLSGWGRVVQARAAVAAGRVALPEWERTHTPAGVMAAGVWVDLPRGVRQFTVRWEQGGEPYGLQIQETDLSRRLAPDRLARRMADMQSMLRERLGDGLVARRALETAEAWLACPCEEHLEALGHMNLTGGEGWVDGWPQWGMDVYRLARDEPPTLLWVEPFTRLAGGQPVLREAIQRELIAWALGEPGYSPPGSSGSSASR